MLNVGEHHLEYRIQPGNGPAVLFLIGGYTRCTSSGLLSMTGQSSWYCDQAMVEHAVR